MSSTRKSDKKGQGTSYKASTTGLFSKNQALSGMAAFAIIRGSIVTD
jgi:hypothetical protein